jgi:hypothetical protein
VGPVSGTEHDRVNIVRPGYMVSWFANCRCGWSTEVSSNSRGEDSPQIALDLWEAHRKETTA